MSTAALPARHLIFLLAALGFASSVAMRICDPMLPELARQFSQPLTNVAPVVGLFSLAYGITMIVFGPIGDRLGKVPVIACCALLAGLASLLSAAAASLDALILARALTGGGAAGIIPLAFATIGDSVPYAQRQVTIAKVVSGLTLGIIAGQALGGVLIDALGWRYAFAIQAALFLLPGIALATVVIRGPRVLFQRPNKSSPQFILRDSVIGYREIFTDPWARQVLLAVSCEGFLCFGALAFMPSLLHDRFELPLWQAGLATALYGVGGFTYTMFAPALLARFGERILVRIGWCTLAGSLFGVVLAPSWLIAALFCLTMGLGFYCQHNTLQTHGTQIAPARRGMAIACFTFVYFSGQAIGIALVSLLAPKTGFTAVFVAIAVALVVLGTTLEAALSRHHGGSHALGK